jgi:hypothetical protein
MTRETLGIVKSRGPLHFTVRIVARDTTNTPVRRVVAPAIGQPVRLEADIVDVVRAFAGDLQPCAVALAAKVRRFFSRKRAEMPHGAAGDLAIFLDCSHVSLSRPMAALALNTWHESFQV